MGLLLIAGAFLLPIRTVYSGHDGPQPRDSLVQYFGLAGVLPALVVLVVVGVAAWLLGFGRTTASTVGVVLARVIAGFLLVVVLVAIAFTNIVGVLAVPLVGALLGAVWATGSASGAGPPAGWYPNPEGGGQRYWSGATWTERTAV